MDAYLPSPDEFPESLVCFSALYSPDVVFQARLSHRIHETHNRTTTAIGGAALSGLTAEQLALLARFFDYVLVGHDVSGLLKDVLQAPSRRHGSAGVVLSRNTPPMFGVDYSLTPLSDVVAVYNGHGCHYGKCRFCDYPSRSGRRVAVRPPEAVAFDFHSIARNHSAVREIFLTRDAYTHQGLLRMVRTLSDTGTTIPYSLMLRPEWWLCPEIASELWESNCKDVFLGADGLDDSILGQMGKGTSVRVIESSITALAEYVDVIIGLVLFVPGVTEEALARQCATLRQLLPYVTAVEPEVLTVVNESQYALTPAKFGIVVNVPEKSLNDSWCFGLSHDIPWTLADKKTLGWWFAHVEKVRTICGSKVAPQYWSIIESIQRRLGF
ncbi:MAG: radical SAM protein [Candidatus Eisenbacteria bacterium]